jgi:hypothetical protein
MESLSSPGTLGARRRNQVIDQLWKISGALLVAKRKEAEFLAVPNLRQPVLDNLVRATL